MKKELTKAPDPSLKTKLILYAKSAGRCSFRGCSKLLIKEALTGEGDINLGNIAHIVAESYDGPRGNDSMSLEDRAKIDNLMLMCRDHHKFIDDGPAKYTKEILINFKKEHEKSIEYLSGFIHELKSLPIILVSKIHDHPANIKKEDVRNTTMKCGGHYPAFALTQDEVFTINLNTLPENAKTSWKTGLKIIDQKIERFFQILEDAKINHVSAFGLARIPYLIYLGYKLGDKVDSEIYQKSRETNSWDWQTEDNTVKFKLQKIQDKGKNKIALILALSANINKESLPDKIKKEFTIYKLSPVNCEPNTEIIKSRKDSSEFFNKFREVLWIIENNMPTKNKEIHLFPAIPVSAAVNCGKYLMKSAPSLNIYDKINGEYKFIIKIK